MASREQPGRHNVIHAPTPVDDVKPVEAVEAEGELAQTETPNSDAAPTADSNEAI